MSILLAVFLLQIICPVNTFASVPQTIRVGYFAFPGYHEISQDENGAQGSGYGFDFLQLLRRYTNLNYEYIGYEDSWQDMQQMLRAVQSGEKVITACAQPDRDPYSYVEDGKQAVELFSDSPAGTFDIILMDIMMPKMNGYEATKAIRNLKNRPDGRTIPIIAMTANAFAEDVQASMDAGMNGHLSKPIVMDEVVKTIARNLDR